MSTPTLTIQCNRSDLVRALKATMRAVCREKWNASLPISKIWGVIGANQTLSLYATDGHRLVRADVTTAPLDAVEGEHFLTPEHARDILAEYKGSAAVSVPLTLTRATDTGARPGFAGQVVDNRATLPDVTFVRQLQQLATNSIQPEHVSAEIAKRALTHPGNRVSKNARVHFSVERETWHTRVVTSSGEGEPVLLTSAGTWRGKRMGAEIRINQKYLNDAIAECNTKERVTISFGNELAPMTICYSQIKVVIMPVRFSGE